MSGRKPFVTAALLLTVLTTLRGAAEPTPAEERIQWFKDAKFGLFIHFGVYSVLGEGEWVMKVNKISVADYEKLPPRFNPEKFSAKEWVDLAKRAGMKYIVVTTKHHDGFCMFDSKLTDYTIVKATPFKRDLIGELATECQKQGMKIGFYYSILDWHHPDYTPAPDWDKDNPTRKGGDFTRYLKYMEGQLRELCTNYGKVDVLWYDGGWEHKGDEDRKELARINTMVRELQPGILINNRANLPEDFGTPEQYVPPTGLKGDDDKPIAWEACLTMTTGHGSHPPTAWWGYDKDEKIFKTKEEVIRTLIDVVSKGGNLLLNVGPRPDGVIQKEFLDNLEAAGDWLKVNGETIYGTTASPVAHTDFWGRVTVKGKTWYLHTFEWPPSDQFGLPGAALNTGKLEGMDEGKFPSEAIHLLRVKPDMTGSFLNQAGTYTGLPAPYRNSGDLYRYENDGVICGRPAEKQIDPAATVVVVKWAEPPKVKVFVSEAVPQNPGPGVLYPLPVLRGDLHGQLGQHTHLELLAGKPHLGGWVAKSDCMSWDFDGGVVVAGAKPSTYRVILDYACDKESAGGELVASVGQQEVKFTVKDTGGASAFQEVAVGELTAGPGKQTLTLTPASIPDGKELMKLRGVVLKEVLK